MMDISCIHDQTKKDKSVILDQSKGVQVLLWIGLFYNKVL